MQKYLTGKVVIFVIISSIVSAFAYFLSSGGLEIGSNAEFISLTNTVISSFFIFFLSSFIMIPLFIISGFTDRIHIAVTGFVCVLSATVITLLSYVDGSLFISMGVHLLDKVAIETVKSGTLFQLIQVDDNELLGLIPFILFFCSIFMLFFYLSYKCDQKFSRNIKLLSVVPLISSILFIISLFYINFGEKYFPESLKSDLPGYDFFYLGGRENNLKSVNPDYTVSKKDLTNIKNKKNVLFIVAESMNIFAIDPALTPNINNFFQGDGLVNSEKHKSSALYTEYSIFTLLYGLDNQYYRPFSKKNIESYPLKLLKKNGYRIAGASASPLKKWRKHAKFIADRNFGSFKEFSGGLSSDKDLLEFVRKNYNSSDKNRPYFYFLFLNSTHHPYLFEKEFEKFTPFQSKDFSFLTKISDPEKRKAIKNRYMNSVNYMDSIFGEIIEVFRSDIEDQNLAVVFTSDHGEEFWEYGKLGHGKHFNNARSVVPLKMKLPGVKSTTVKLSGAVSIFPTIIDYLQPENKKPVLKYMNGHSLFPGKSDPGYFITGSSTFPFHDNRIELTGLSGSILARKSGNSMTKESTFSIIARRAPDGSDLPESEFKNVDAYLTDFTKNYMKFVKIKKGK